ncbi:hypothetical protein HPB51_028321 [Rhipicephalus microplus]|uniref:60S ribosomal protein L29 n=1 Tax=Rhipicephalus microplus TaxID=6941 RepID=A0A9J6CX82_RHIMP|nr:hypothetical protein HPB51_028321 [Rhipicephalus microplus]
MTSSGTKKREFAPSDSFTLPAGDCANDVYLWLHVDSSDIHEFFVPSSLKTREQMKPKKALKGHNKRNLLFRGAELFGVDAKFVRNMRFAKRHNKKGLKKMRANEALQKEAALAAKKAL